MKSKTSSLTSKHGSFGLWVDLESNRFQKSDETKIPFSFLLFEAVDTLLSTQSA